MFEPCHKLVPLLPYLGSCTVDNCYGGNDTCSSLEAYATECAEAGVCIDWRNATGGQCGKIMFIYILVCVFIVYLYIFICISLKYSLYILQSTSVQVTKCTWPVALLWSPHVMKGKVIQKAQT